MKKILISTLLILIILSINCFVLGVSNYESISNMLKQKYDISLDEAFIEDNTYETEFKNAIAENKAIIVFRQWNYSIQNPEAREDYIYFTIANTSNVNNIYQFRATDTEIYANVAPSLRYYRLNLQTAKIDKIASSNYQTLNQTYSIVSFPALEENWKTEQTMNYIAYKLILGGLNGAGYSTQIGWGSYKYYSINGLENPVNWEGQDPYPDETPSPNPNPNTPQNYGKYIEQPYIITNWKGLVFEREPFQISYKSGDSYELDTLAIRLETFENVQQSGENTYIANLKERRIIEPELLNFQNENNVLSTNYFDNYADTSYTYRITLVYRDGTASYDLDKTSLFTYSPTTSYIQNIKINDWNNEQIEIDTSSLNGILGSARGVVEELFSFWNIFPQWLTILISTGITIVIILRVLDR